MRGEVRLNYCIVDSESRSVSDFAHLHPSQRPSAFCPSCGGQLALKLGTSGKIAHHAAHRSDSSGCYLSTPEGALHFNTKMFIAEQLRTGTQLLVKHTCSKKSYPWPCESYRPHTWQVGWDTVEVEYHVGSVKPDIVLLKNGIAQAAIEICVSHKVDEKKAEKLLLLDVPWLEINASGTAFDERFVFCDFEDGYEDSRWTIDRPIHYDRISPSLDKWTCWRCLNDQKRIEEEAAQAEIREAKRRFNEERLRREKVERKNLYLDQRNNKVIFARAIEFISLYGKRRRYDFFVVERYVDGYSEPTEVYIKNGRFGAEILFSQEPADREGKRLLNEQFRHWLGVMQVHSQSFNWLTTGWVSEQEYERQVATLDSPFDELMKNLAR